MIRCLYCGTTIDGDDRNAGDSWHARCAKRFFGVRTVPELSIDAKSLERYALENLNAGLAVTGVQRKLSLHLQKQDRNTPFRLTLIGYPAGFILKPPSPEFPYLVELEQVTMRMAGMAGLKTVPHSLIRMADGKLAYITRRVDREIGSKDTRKIPMEDFCQLGGRLTEDKYKGSYEQCAKLIGKYSDRPGLDLTEFFLLLLFSFVTGNGDMHLKNFSLLKDSSGWILSPAYDLLPTKLLIPEDHEELALTLQDKRARLKRADFMEFGTAAGLSALVTERLIDQMVTRSAGFHQLLPHAYLDAETETAFSKLIAERRGRLGMS